MSQGSKKRRTGGRNSRSPAKLREAPDRSSMTMQELIYYNPSANPMRCVYTHVLSIDYTSIMLLCDIGA